MLPVDDFDLLGAACGNISLVAHRLGARYNGRRQQLLVGHPGLGFSALDHAHLHLLDASQRLVGFDWVWIALGLLADLGMYGGGAYGNRGRIQGVY